MFKRIYLILMVLAGLAALTFVINGSLKERPIAKIKWSQFTNPEEVAQAISMRLRQEVKDNPIVFIGVDPSEEVHFQIWSEWVKKQIDPGWRFDQIYREPELKGGESWSQALPYDIRKYEDQFIEILTESLKKSERVLALLPHVYVSQRLANNPVQRIQTKLGRKILSLSLVDLSNNQIPCLKGDADFTGQGALGCLIAEKNLALRTKKNFNEASYVGLLDQYGFTDFLMFLKHQ